MKGATAGSIENGDVPLKASDIPKIAKLLGVEPWQLFIDSQTQKLMAVSNEEEVLVLTFRKIKKEKTA